MGQGFHSQATGPETDDDIVMSKSQRHGDAQEISDGLKITGLLGDGSGPTRLLPASTENGFKMCPLILCCSSHQTA